MTLNHAFVTFNSICRSATSYFKGFGSESRWKAPKAMAEHMAVTLEATQATGLSTPDLAICVGYLLSVLCVGFFFTFKEQRDREKLKRSVEAQKAARRMGLKDAKADESDCLEQYYLGGRKIPWWALAVADVSSYIDISGTMINTALVYALGIKGMYIELRGGLCTFLAFQLAYTGKLSRRCPVKTRGEW